MADDLLDAPGLDWKREDADTFSCPVTWHGERGELLLELGGSGPARLSLIGPRGVLWTLALEGITAAAAHAEGAEASSARTARTRRPA